MIFSGGTTTEGSLTATWRHHQGEIGSGPTDGVSAVAILAAHPRSRAKVRQRRRARSQLADQHPAQAHDRDQQRRKKAIHPKRQTIDGPHQLGARGRNLDPETTGLPRQLLAYGADLIGQLLTHGADLLGQLVADRSDLFRELLTDRADLFGELLADKGDLFADVVPVATFSIISPWITSTTPAAC
jgi:hypothetical protein